MKIYPILNKQLNKNQYFGNKNISKDIMDVDYSYPVKNPKRYTFEFIDIPLERDATDLPSYRFLHTDTMRINELFDTEKDYIKEYIQYSTEDVPLNDNLVYGAVKRNNKDAIRHVTSSKDGDTKFKESVHSPWIGPSDLKDRTDTGRFLDEARQKIKKISENRQSAKKIFEDCTIIKQGKFTIDKNLCRLAVDILENSEDKLWGETEQQIVKDLKIPIFKNTYGAVFSHKYALTNYLLWCKKSNPEILAKLKTLNPIDLYKLHSIL